MTISKLNKIRIAIAAVLAIGAAACATEANVDTDSKEAIVYSTRVTYYSDASHKKIVGWFKVNCAGEISQSGVETEFFTDSDTRCGGRLPTEEP